MKKKILGLDLGVGSIGWALIETKDDTPSNILGMGSRIVPISNDDSDQFPKAPRLRMASRVGKLPRLKPVVTAKKAAFFNKVAFLFVYIK